MRWLRLLLITFSLLLLLVGGSLVWLHNSDLEVFKPYLERWVADKTGRTLRIQGRLDIQVGRNSTLLVEDIHFSDASWSSREDLASLERIYLQVDLWSLIRGPISLPSLEVDGLTVWLETTASGQHNWQLQVDDNESPKADSTGLPVVLGQMAFTQAQFTYLDPVLEKPLHVAINELIQQHLPDDSITLQANGTVNQTAMSASLQASTLQSLLTGKQLAFALEGQVGDLTLNSSGRIGDLKRLSDPEFTLQITGPNTEYLMSLLGIRAIEPGPLDVMASIKTVDGSIKIEAGGHLGDLHYDVDGSVSDFLDPKTFKLKVDANGPNLGRLARLFHFDDLPDAPFTLSGSVHRNNSDFAIDHFSFLVGETKLSAKGSAPRFPDSNGANLDLKLIGPEIANFRDLLGLPGISEGPFSLILDLDGTSDGFNISGGQLTLTHTELDITGLLGAPPYFTGTKVHIKGQGDSLRKLGEAWGWPGLISDPIKLESDVIIDGHEQFTLRQGLLHLGEDVLEFEGTINLKSASELFDITFKASGDDLAQVIAMADITQLPMEPYQLNGSVRMLSNHFELRNIEGTIGATEFKLAGDVARKEILEGTNLTIDFNSEALNEWQEVLGDVELPISTLNAKGSVRLGRGEIALNDFQIQTEHAQAKLDAGIKLPLSAGVGHIAILGKGDDLKKVLPTIKGYQPPAKPFTVNTRVSWNKAQVAFETLALSIAKGTLELRGQLNLPPNYSATEMELKADILDLSALGTINNKPLPQLPLKISALLSGSPSELHINKLTGQLGKSDFDGQLSLSLESIPDLDIQLTSRSIDLSPFLTEEEPSTESKRSTKSNRLIPNLPIPMENLKGFNARVHLHADQLLLNQQTLKSVILNASIKDGNLQAEELSFDGSLGKIKSWFSLKTTATGVGLLINLKGQQMPSPFQVAAGKDDNIVPPLYDLTLDLGGSGNNTRELASSLNGVATIMSAGGSINNSRVSMVYSDFLNELVSTINPFMKREPYTQIECQVAAININDGLISFSEPAGLFIGTDKINIFSAGTIDLGTEKLDINFRTSARGKVGISAGDLINPFINLAGTLSKPRITMDKMGTAAAIATGGMSVIATGAWRRIFRKKNPCKEALRLATERMAEEK